MNLYCLGTGTPTVILEAGAGGSTLDWRRVQGRIAKLTRVCAYDRAGMGFSDPGTLPRTAKVVMDDFVALLQAAQLKPPYVLVGHSLGSYFVRLYADHYLSNVVGMVLVDPSVEYQDTRMAAVSPQLAELISKSDEESRECARLAQSGELKVGSPLFKACTFGNKRDPAFSDTLFQVVTRRRLSAAFRVAYVSEIDNMEGQDSADLTDARRSYGSIPLIVLSAADSGPEPGVSSEQIEAVAQLFRQMHQGLADLSSRGMRRQVENSGHYVQLDRPEVVIGAVGEVLAGSAARAPCRQTTASCR